MPAGITIDLGGCTTSPVTVLTIYIGAGANDDPCCFWPVTEFGGSPGDFVEPFTFIDCNNVTREGRSAVGQNINACCRDRENAPARPTTTPAISRRNRFNPIRPTTG